MHSARLKREEIENRFESPLVRNLFCCLKKRLDSNFFKFQAFLACCLVGGSGSGGPEWSAAVAAGWERAGGSNEREDRTYS